MDRVVKAEKNSGTVYRYTAEELPEDYRVGYRRFPDGKSPEDFSGGGKPLILREESGEEVLILDRSGVEVSLYLGYGDFYIYRVDFPELTREEAEGILRGILRRELPEFFRETERGETLFRSVGVRDTSTDPEDSSYAFYRRGETEPFLTGEFLP